MGYLSHITGGCTIEPPLDAGELRLLPGLDFGLVLVETVETYRDTDEGTLIVRTGTRLGLITDDGVKAYEFEQDVARAVAAVADAGDGHAVNGTFRVEGEDQGDVWRLVVTGGRIARENARLIWPDGATENLSRG